MQGAFIQALTYSPPSVLGRQLCAFSSWHGILLEAADSPYIVGGIPKLDDMVLGVWVCSRSYADGWAGATDIAAVSEWGKNLKDHDFPKALATFGEYITASFMGPEYWSSGSGSSIRAPYMWHLATFGMMHLHLTDVEAWDYPIARMVCHYACKSESEGNKDLISNDDLRGMEVLKADAEKEKEAKQG